MDQDEFDKTLKKIQEEMIKAMEQELLSPYSQPTSYPSVVPTPTTFQDYSKVWEQMRQLAKDAQIQWGPSPVQAVGNMTIRFNHYNYNGESPTSVKSRGMYPYQEPERDEQGTMYGYKVLLWDGQHFQSPRYHGDWFDGVLEADQEPAEDSMHGIHCTKYPDHPELEFWYSTRRAWDAGDRFLVKCALSGTVVETEQGFRAQKAQIIGVLLDGRWASYEDLSRLSKMRNYYDQRDYPYSW